MNFTFFPATKTKKSWVFHMDSPLKQLGGAVTRKNLGFHRRQLEAADIEDVPGVSRCSGQGAVAFFKGILMWIFPWDLGQP